MRDKQPLLTTSKQVSFDNNNEQPSINNLFHWRQWLRKREDGHIDKNTPVSVVQLFRFADRIDHLLMFVSMCGSVLAAVSVVVSIALFGQLAGLFAIESFGNDNTQQQQNSLQTIRNNITCPFGIDLNSNNLVHFSKLCQHDDVIFSSTLAIPTPVFRRKVMHIVHWLLINGISVFFSAYVSTILWLISTRRQISRMNILLFRSLLQRNILYFDTTPTDHFNAEQFANIQTIETGIGYDFIVCQVTLLCIISSLVISFIINWQLSLMMVCIIPFVFLISFLLGKFIAHETMNGLNAYSQGQQIIEEVLSSLRTVLAFNGNKYEQKRYRKALDRTRWNGVRKGAALGLYKGWLYLVTYIVYSVGFIFGSILMSQENQNTFNISDILPIVSVFALCIEFLSSIGTSFQSVSEAQAAAITVFRLIDEAENTSMNETDLWQEDEASDPRSLAEITGDIEFNAVNFTYPSRKDVSVLRNLSFIARAGQTTALVGTSGSGKSTCISLLVRQYQLSSGQIHIGNRSINNFSLKQLRQNIGVVNQEPILFGTSIYENIRFGKVNATRTEIEGAARQANAHNFIMQLPDKYETFVGERGIQLSGGEKQRIALARALVKQPSILLLDEATSALDNASEKIVQEALDRACKNRTTIVIAHRLSTIRNADQIYVLDKGSVIEEGTHETLMNKDGGKYQTLVNRQQMRSIADEDTLKSMEQVMEEDQLSIVERTRSLTDHETIDAHKESSRSSEEKSIFRRILSANTPEWKIILIACILCSISGAAQVAFAILLTNIVNAFKHFIQSERHYRILIASCLFLLLGVIVLVLRFFQYIAFAMAGSELVQRIRLKTFACLLRQEIAFFDRSENSSGAISVRLSADAAALEKMVGTRLGTLCEAVALAVFGFLLGIFFSLPLTMIVFVDLVIIILSAYLTIRLNMHLKKQSNVILRKANMFAVEMIHSIRTVKQLSVEQEVLRQYSESIHQAQKISWKSIFVTALTPAIINATEAYLYAFLYWCALVLYEKNELVLDNIIIVFSFGVFATEASKIIGILPDHIGSSLSAANSFFDLFDRTPAIDNASTEGQELIDFRGEIKFDQVKFIYPARPTSTVLKKLQLTVKSGQRVALVGTSGCGKSTIIQLLERFYDVTHGQLLLDNIDIRRLNIQWIRSRLGLVSQEPILFDLTIAENITYGLENVPMDEVINAAIKANIHDFIQQLPQGYETRVGVKGSFLSGGEKQRVAIARVLLRRPKILLLDEATSALDSTNEQIVQEALEQAQTEDPTRTSLIVAHRLSTIRSCDVICVLENGHIVESGTHTELVQRRGLYFGMLTQHSSSQ